VHLYVDMYGGRHVFKGRISGFTEGTGLTLALLPAQNATGNFIKVVQRLPVRIDLENYDPDKSPLFIGTSVVPYVYSTSRPPDPMPGSFYKLGRMRQNHKLAVRLQTHWAQRSDSHSAFARQIPCRGEPVAGGRHSRSAHLHGGARHHNRGGRAALHRRRPVGRSRRQ
jgi:hypothetical protein